MNIIVGVKYCGGCNPNYDRKEIADIIERQSGISLAAYEAIKIPDITLVICGCTSDCVKIDKYKSKYETILINSPEQINEVIKTIRSLGLKLSDPE